MSAEEETRKMREHFTTGFKEKQNAWKSHAMHQLPNDHPIIIAWEVYKKSTEYANTRKWALKEKHVDGSLWSAFSTGYLANETFHKEVTP